MLLLAALLLIGLGVLVFTAFLVISRSDEQYDLKNGNDRPWFMAQMALEAQRVTTALAETGLETDPEKRAIAFANAKEKFDIYYSRVKTLEERGELFLVTIPGAALEQKSKLDAIIDHLGPLTELIDSVTSPERGQLLNLLNEFTRIEPVIRSISLDMMAAIAANSIEKKQDEDELLRYFIAIAICMFFVLSVAAFLSFLAETRLQDEVALQSKLRSSLDKVVSASNDAIIICDAIGTPIKVNDAAAALFHFVGCGCESGDLVEYLLLVEPNGESPLAQPAARQTLMSWLYAESGRPSDQDKKPRAIKNADGAYLTAEIMVTQDIDHLTDDTAFIIFIRDITQIVQTQAELRFARDEALHHADVKSRFLAMMGHEMRTPLHCAITAIDLLQPEEFSTEAEELVSIASASTRDALQHVDDILERTSMTDGLDANQRPEAIDPARIIRSVLAELEVVAKERNTVIEFESNLPADFAFNSRAEIFRRAVRSVAENAVKFTENGIVRIEISEQTNSAGERCISVSIEDTGIGIHQDDQIRIFEDFESLDQGYTRKSNGVGLGLGIAYRAVRQLGGTMNLTSEPGSGSSFFLEIPNLNNQLVPQAQASEDRSALVLEAYRTCTAFDPTPITILVVEDHELNRRLIGKMLDSIGYTPDYAVDGLEAVSMAKNKKYSLILMDISMPNLDGVQATRAIRTGNSASAFSRITAITANALIEERSRFMQAGMDSVLAKPVSQDQLKNEVRMLTMKHLDGRPQLGQNNHSSADTLDANTMPAPDTTLADTKEASREPIQIDLAVLEMLTDLMDHAELRQKIDTCFDEVNQALAAVRAMESASDKPAIAQQVHKSAGVAAMIGTPHLHRNLCELEDALRSKTDVDTAAALSTAEKAFFDAQSALRAVTADVA